MGMVLVLTRVLAHTVETLAQTVAAGQQALTLLIIQRHGVQRILQLQARFAQLLLLDLALLGRFLQFVLQTATAQAQLLGFGLAGGQLCLQLTYLARQFLAMTALLLTLFFLKTLLVAQRQQAFIQLRQGRLTFLALQLQALQLLATSQHTAIGLGGATHAQEMPANPVAVAADQAFAIGQVRASRQRLLQGFDRTHTGQPGRQVMARFDLVQQATGTARAALGGAGQAQFALLQRGEIQPGEIVQQHGLQVGTEHGFHRQLPTGFHPQTFGQARALQQVLLTQPLASTLPRIERRLLQRLQRGQATAQALQLALRLLLGLTGLLQFLAQLLQALGLLLFGQVQGFLLQLTGSELFVQFENGGVFGVGHQLLQFFVKTTLAFCQTLQALFQLGDARLLHFGLATRLGTALVETVPLLLPAVHGDFGLFQAGSGLLGSGGSHLLLGQEHFQLFTEGGQQGAVVA